MSAIRRASQATRDEGSLTAFFALVAVALFVMVGWVVDEARAIGVHRELAATAAEAARIGANRLSIDALRQGKVTIVPEAAITAAEQYLASVGERGSAVVSGETVRVEVSGVATTTILRLVGINVIPVSASATATNLQGVTEGQT